MRRRLLAALPLSLRKASGFPLIVYCLRLCLGGVAAESLETRTERQSLSARRGAEPLAFLLASSLMTSCSRAPSFDILGSYFPAWLICLTLAVVLTVVIRWVLLRLQIEVVFPIVVYPSLTALFAFGMWLVFYG